MYQGSCLCKGVTYEIRGKISPVGHCHCSKCRKVSGTGSNAVCWASPDDLVWLSGKELIRKFSLPDGWSSTFCSVCGSPLPQCHPEEPVCHVPAGTLDDDPGHRVMGHIHVASKASWDYIGDSAPRFEEDAPR